MQQYPSQSECTGREAKVGAAGRHVQVDGASAVGVVQDLAEVLHHRGDALVCDGVAYPGQPPRAAAPPVKTSASSKHGNAGNHWSV